MASRIATIVLPLSLALIPFLSACRAVNVSGDYALDSSKSTGVAVVSLTYAGLPSGFNMFVDLRGVDVDYKNAVPISDMFASADWRCPFLGKPSDDSPCGRLAVLELQQGEYEFYSWRGGTSGGPGGFTITVRSTEPFSKRFRVIPGKAVYLGNVHFSVGRSSPSLRAPYQMRVSDLRQRDLALLHQKNPRITPDNVVVNILPN